MVADGACLGAIRSEPVGQGGFGYDPVFEIPGHGRTLAELPEQEKNRLSHRGRALLGLRSAIAGLQPRSRV